MSAAAVVGGGNIGTLIAGELSARGHEVRVFTSDPEVWPGSIDVIAPDESHVCRGRLALVTNVLSEAVKDAEWVFVTHPSSRFAILSRDLVPLIEHGQHVVVLPGADAEYFFAGIVERGADLLGFQRVHSIARLKERGRSVYQLGRKPELQIASIPSKSATFLSNELSKMFDMPVETLPNYLVETLTPSNPILHTTRLATMFHDWGREKTYDRNIPFYETWDDASSRLMIACDLELQSLCRAIGRASGLDLSGVRPLTEHYESPDASSMTDKIAHIPAFKGLGSPMKEISEGVWVPDFSSRYFRADFEIGLRIIIELANAFGVDVPNMQSVMAWYESAAKPLDGPRIVPNDAKAAIEPYLI